MTLWRQQPGAEPGTPIPPENNTLTQFLRSLLKSGAKMRLCLPLCSWVPLKDSYPTLMGTRWGWGQQMRNGDKRESLPSWYFISAQVPWKPVSKPLTCCFLHWTPWFPQACCKFRRGTQDCLPGITVDSKYPGDVDSC